MASSNRIRLFPTRAPLCGALVALSIFSLALGDARAQPAEKKKPAVREEVLKTDDGWNIPITYYESADGREAPVVILLHSKLGNRLAWANGFAKRLQDEGYAVIAPDLRKHGQSSLSGVDALPAAVQKRVGGGDELNNRDYLLMITQDLPAIKRFIYEEHQQQKLNMRKTAIVGADMTTPIAVNYAFADWTAQPFPDAPTLETQTPRGQDVRAVVLLSPEENLPLLQTGQLYKSLRSPLWNIAFLVAVGDQDAQDRGAAKRINQQLTATAGNDARMYLQKYKTKFRGTELIGRQLGADEHILGFFKLHLKGLNAENDAWRDRKSRLED